MPGPVPNREADLARPRSRKGGDVQEVTKGEMRPVKIPNADRDWHPIARRLWDSLKTSGQADFYQNSDWAFAFSLCEDLSHYKKSGKRSGQMLQTIYSAFERLLVAEGDRRRVRIELHEPEPETTPASVLAIADYRQELGLD
ncbi:terminase small subunit [Streptomyces phage Maneekul]|uniref:Terminase small subunit n=1 Tax=Streptomyces phage Yasdnil TaxID=2593360 RepID=A0A514U4C0_9CAUD|nr:minor tail protein [Streptomyces phage Yasdnil]AWN07375.1 terminase small subunit [Streptomyces phage Maneekul]QDK03176.1 terminase small subunit [Streptomyces phage TuanPN]QDK03730.1 terminase small subunit [Streptomyces phage Yasdnil]USH46015.1 terminase small subunit [Streptomyces phage Ejemplo]